MAQDSQPPPDHGLVGFPATPWSSIQRAAREDTTERGETLRRLLERYWRPVWVAIRFGHQREPEEAEQLVEGFFCDLQRQDVLREIDPAQGPFRSFLKGRLSQYLEKAGADPELRRPAGASRVSLDGARELVSAASGAPDEVFDREWMALLIERSVAGLQRELGSGQELAWELFERIDLCGEEEALALVAEREGSSEAAMRGHLLYARKRLRRLASDEIRTYAVDEGDVRRELEWILH